MSDLERIVKLAEILVQQQTMFKELEQRTKDAKAAMLQTEREDLPMLMAEAGLQEIKLSDGSIVRITEDCDAKITDRTREGALSWLVDNGFGGLVKTQVSVAFGRGMREEASEVRDRLAEQYEGVELKEDVHHSTLKAFVKEQLAEGRPIPMDLFNVHPYNKATLKKGA